MKTRGATSAYNADRPFMAALEKNENAATPVATIIERKISFPGGINRGQNSMRRRCPIALRQAFVTKELGSVISGSRSRGNGCYAGLQSVFRGRFMNSKSQIVIGTALFGAVWLAPTARTQATAELKNVQVLKGVSPSEINETMGFIASALGVTCNHCHLGPWESDAQKTKLTAREMIRMTREINERAFGGRTEVSCYTCHQAHAK